MFAVLAFGIAATAWGLRTRRSAVLAVVAGLGLVAMVAGTVAGVDGYPWSNLVVLGESVALGAVVGRVISPTARAMFVTLGLLAILDAAQLLLGGGTGSGVQPWEMWFHVLVLGADGSTVLKIGVVDLVLVAAIAEHWRRRGAAFWLATLTGPVGLLGSSIYAWIVRPAGGLVLVPFLFLAWVLSELWWRWRGRGRTDR